MAGLAPCVCIHEAADHHAWTGACNGGCGCSYYEPDSGNDGTRAGATSYGGPHTKYTGIYAKPYTLDQESA